jgi:hypothetical protein
MVKTDTHIEEQIRAIFSGDAPWVTILWDDPVNLMTYVTYVLMELFGYSKEKAQELMMKVHTEEKQLSPLAVVKRWNMTLLVFTSTDFGQRCNAGTKRYDF